MARRRRAWLLAGLALPLTLLPALPARAHAIVKSTEPGIDQVVAESPHAVVMEFNEPVEIAFGAIRVFDTNGRRVDVGDAGHPEGEPDAVRIALRPDLPDGTYTVTWRVVSADGHPIEEAFVFHVGEPGENPLGIAGEILAGQGGAGRVEGILAGVGRWLNFASLLLLAGAMVFLPVVWLRTRMEAGPRPSEVEDRFWPRWRRVVVWSWVAVVVATLVNYVLQGSLAADIPVAEALSLDVFTRLAETRYGIVSIAKLLLLLAAAGLWFAVRDRLRPARSVGAAAAVELERRQRVVPVWAIAAAGALAVALLATPGLSGHAGTTSPVALNVVVDTLHVLGAAAWLGGLVLLLVAVYPAARGMTEPERLRALGPVVVRYSTMAVLAMTALVLSGVFRAWIEVRALRALVDAPYGWVLLVKLAAFAPIGLLGLVNNRWTIPKISEAAKAERAEESRIGTLRKLVTVEVAMATVVLAVTAFLVNLAPARVEAGVEGPFITDVRLAENNLNVLVDPNQVGENEVHLTLTSPAGAPIDVEEMRVRFRMPEGGIGPIPAPATELAAGHFVVQGRQLSVKGEWEVEVIVRFSEFEEERTRVTVQVN